MRYVFQHTQKPIRVVIVFFTPFIVCCFKKIKASLNLMSVHDIGAL